MAASTSLSGCRVYIHSAGTIVQRPTLSMKCWHSLSDRKPFRRKARGDHETSSISPLHSSYKAICSPLAWTLIKN